MHRPLWIGCRHQSRSIKRQSAALTDFCLWNRNLLFFIHKSRQPKKVAFSLLVGLSELVLFYFFKSRAGKKMILDSEIDGVIENFSPDKLKVGEVSAPLIMRTEEGKQAYRIIYLKIRTQPHRANMQEDYDRIQQWAKDDKNADVIQKWIKEKVKQTYVNIIPEYNTCVFENKWMN
jgi:hypothetical protein